VCVFSGLNQSILLKALYVVCFFNWIGFWHFPIESRWFQKKWVGWETIEMILGGAHKWETIGKGGCMDGWVDGWMDGSTITYIPSPTLSPNLHMTWWVTNFGFLCVICYLLQTKEKRNLGEKEGRKGEHMH